VHLTRAVPYLAAAAALAWSAPEQRLMLSLTGDDVRARTPGFRMIAGRALERLKNGTPVTFAFQFTASHDGGITIARRALERFVVSYDLWEEKYSVAQLLRPHSAGRAGSRVSPEAVEAWCLDHVPLSTAGLAPDRPTTFRLEVAAEDPRDNPVLTDPGVSLTALIDLFSRPARGPQQRWRFSSDAVRLADLKR
jgi:hypothetical protein